MSSFISFASSELCLSEFLMPLTSDLKQLYDIFIDHLQISEGRHCVIMGY